MSIICRSNLETIQVQLDSSSSLVSCLAHWGDVVGGVVNGTEAMSVGTNFLTVVPAPNANDSRVVSGMSFYNGDSVPRQVKVYKFSSTSAFPIVMPTIQPGCTLLYDNATGWKVMDAFGSIIGNTTQNSSVNQQTGYNPTFRNLYINPQHQISQRGTSFTTTGDAYTLDRFLVQTAGTTCTTSQQTFASGVYATFGYEFTNYARYVVSSVAGASNYAARGQRMEGVNVTAGQHVPYTLWVRGSTAGLKIAFEGYQYFGTGGSAIVSGISIQTVTIAAANVWQKVSVAFDFPSVLGKTIGPNSYSIINCWMDAGTTFNARTNSLGQQSGTFEFAAEQPEIGYNATPFENRPPANEAMLCQRYYRTSPVGTLIHIIGAPSAPAYRAYLQFGNTMRTTPAAIGLLSSFPIELIQVSIYAMTAVPTVTGGVLGPNGGYVDFTSATTSTVTNNVFAQLNNDGVLGFNAEL